jgi:hypothetical protein
VALLVRHDPCAWLPAGGTADVVLSAAPPLPVSVVRLLVTAPDAVLVVERPDRRGLDLPSTRVTGSAAEALDALCATYGVGSARQLGYVRNAVPGAPPGYPWPVPAAHFVVFHAELERGAERAGQWVAGPAVEAELSARHWWPLLAHAR